MGTVKRACHLWIKDLEKGILGRKNILEVISLLQQIPQEKVRSHSITSIKGNKKLRFLISPGSNLHTGQYHQGDNKVPSHEVPGLPAPASSNEMPPHLLAGFYYQWTSAWQ